ncbi:MAG: hypothetical protein K0V04_44200 [Deltaproteobacteria bacterium]|nr:hypothetical protein [Deltaproteobacteria bacterium]
MALIPRWVAMTGGVMAMAAALTVAPGTARAGASECGGAHVERGADCEILVSAGCQASCDVNGMLTACAADLMATCQAGCNLDVEWTCTDECQVQCEDQCRADGGQVICTDGCMGECRGACDDRCADAEDPDQCWAACEATCSGECETSCANVPADADCTEACQECCHGSCSARVNLDCQLGCQAGGFADCQQSAAQACEGSCGIEGTLFCDGQFIVSGSEVNGCVDALSDRGIFVRTEIEVDLDGVLEDGQSSARDAVGFCRVSPGSGAWGTMAVLGLLGLVASRRGRP